MDQSDNEYQKLPPDPWPQFSLCGLLLFVTIAGICFWAQSRYSYRSLALQQTYMGTGRNARTT